MQAVIMAGGEGSRLRPLTCNLPKPMARLCGRPILEYILDLLCVNGFDSATLTLGYMSHMIREHFPDNNYKTIKLSYTEEKEPLGTAGGVRKAAEKFDDDFLVISGDGLCDFDLKSAVTFHKQSGAAVTIVVTAVDDPREYGLVNIDRQNNVTGFVEKPSWTGVTTNLANTGIYIINPAALLLIPHDRPFDFANHLFPKMLAEDMVLKAYVGTGYWCDIGDLESYRRCQKDMMNRRIKGIELPQNGQGAFGGSKLGDTFQILPPVYVGDRVSIGPGAVIGPDTVIDDGTKIASGARIRSGIALSNSVIGNNARITGSILCSGSTVGNNAALYENCVLGSGARIGDGAEVMPGVSIWPGKAIDAGVTIRENVKIGEPKREYFDEKGVVGHIGADVTPDFCTRLGAAIGSVNENRRVGIGYCDTNASKAMYYALLAGLSGTGTEIWDFGRITAAQMNFAAAFCGVDSAVYVSGANDCRVEIFGRDGLPITRQTEREIEKYLTRGEFIRCQGEHYRDIADMSSFRLLYQQELYRCAPEGLLGIRSRISCDRREAERLFTDVFSKLGGALSHRPAFHVSDDGCQLTAADEDGRILNSSQMFTLGCRLLFEKGEDVAVPYEAPLAVDQIARTYGQQCHRYINLSFDKQAEIRSLVKKQFWLRDGIMLALKIMNEMKCRNKTLAQLTGTVPDFVTKTTQFPLRESPSEAMERLKKIAYPAKQGVQIASGSTVVRIWPGKRGNVLQILAEADSMEAADELCAELKSKISDLLDRKE